jgi:hypothetical protein
MGPIGAKMGDIGTIGSIERLFSGNKNPAQRKEEDRQAGKG